MSQVDGISPDLSAIKYKRKKKLTPLVRFFREASVVLALSLAVFFVVNLPAYMLILKYRIDPTSVANSGPSEGLFKPKDLAIKAIYPEGTIVIPSIGVNAPVIWQVADENVDAQLQNGVVNLASTGLPSQQKNIFISGHSSNYWWKKGDYNTVFALLGELKQDSDIFLTKDGMTYKYMVTAKTEVDKNDAGKYLNSDGEKLTLMTCVPVGTNLRRLIVEAKPASP
jgi:LPXTG-site transpeptidase (sortase) family protein